MAGGAGKTGLHRLRAHRTSRADQYAQPLQGLQIKVAASKGTNAFRPRSPAELAKQVAQKVAATQPEAIKSVAATNEVAPRTTSAAEVEERMRAYAAVTLPKFQASFDDFFKVVKATAPADPSYRGSGRIRLGPESKATFETFWTEERSKRKTYVTMSSRSADGRRLELNFSENRSPGAGSPEVSVHLRTPFDSYVPGSPNTDSSMYVNIERGESTFTGFAARGDGAVQRMVDQLQSFRATNPIETALSKAISDVASSIDSPVLAAVAKALKRS